VRRSRLGLTSLGQDDRKATTLLARNVNRNLDGRPYPEGGLGYDIRNDQALPSLQTAINEESAHRYRAVRLRPPCLAGIVAYAYNTPPGLSFRPVQSSPYLNGCDFLQV